MIHRARRLALLSVVLAAAAALAVSPETLRADYRSLYVLGLEAVDFELWADGVILFAKAIEEQPVAGGLVRPYGTWTESYVPHYYLGLCLFHLGRSADALEAWAEFERQPPFHYPRNKRKRAALERYRLEIERQLPEQIARARLEVEAARERLQRLRNEPLLIERGGESSATDLEIIATLLDEASSRLEGADDRMDLAEVLRGVEPLLARVQEKLADQDLKEDRLRRQDQIAREIEARRARLERYEQARELLAAGTCSREAIELLLEVVHRSQIGSSELGDEPAPTLRLAQAFVLCSELDRAAQYLEISARRGAAEEPLFASIRERLESAPEIWSDEPVASELADPQRGRPVEWALSAYLEAAGWVATGECRPEAIDLLEAAETVLLAPAEGDAVHLGEEARAIGYTPFLSKARAQWDCGNRAAAEASLARARELGAAPAEAIDAVANRFELDPTGDLYSASHALVVVAHDYHHGDQGWTDLPGAREDVEAIRHSLATHGFTVEVLENPTSELFDRRIKKFVARYGREPTNRIVFYYAGHGWTEEAVGIKNGYVVPVDSPHPSRSEESFEYLISMGVFELYARPMHAQHALFIFDTCFGGLVFERSLTDRDPDDADMPPDELLRNPVRMFMSAGNESQSVPDFSVFRRTVVRGLAGDADLDGNRLVLGNELGRFVQRAVSDSSYTTPQWGTMTGGDLGRGDIVFVPLQGADDAPTETLRTEIDYWSTVWGRDNPQRYRDYLQLYPEGVFARLARWRLETDSEADSSRPGAP